MSRRTVGFILLAVALASPTYAQPKLPGIFQFPVDLSAKPDLARSDAIDVRLRIFDAKQADRLLHEEVFLGLKPSSEGNVLHLRIGFQKRISRDEFVGRMVYYETAARKAGEGDFELIYRSPPVQLVFERPKTLLEKIRLDHWVILGVAGQMLFMMRFLLQWIETERRRESTIPVAFWWCSLGGGLIVLVYGLVEREPIIILGQSCGFLIYARNLFFIYKNRQRKEAPPPEEIA